MARRLAVSALTAAALIAPVAVTAEGARASAPNPAQRVIMPSSCFDEIHHIQRNASHHSYMYRGGRIAGNDQGQFRYGGSGGGPQEQPRSFTTVQVGDGSRVFLSLRKNGELWRHTLSSNGSSGTMIASRWAGITKIVGTDNGIVYAVTSAGGLNAYRLDRLRIRLHDHIGTKGWTTLKSISGYARADGNDSLVAVNAAGELVDYIVTPSGAIRASYPTHWRAGISQVSVGQCDGTPGRPILVVIGSTMYAYYDRDALNGPHSSLADISSVGSIGRGWTGLIG